MEKRKQEYVRIQQLAETAWRVREALRETMKHHLEEATKIYSLLSRTPASQLQPLAMFAERTNFHQLERLRRHLREKLDECDRKYASIMESRSCLKHHATEQVNSEMIIVEEQLRTLKKQVDEIQRL